MVRKTITVDKCEIKQKKDKSGNYHFVNGTYYVWEKENGRIFEDNLGKTYDVEVVEGQYPKIKEIYEEQPNSIEVIKPMEKQEEAPANLPKQNSREFGTAGNRVKIYFEDASDLETQINALKEKNLFPIENGNTPSN